MSVPDLVHPAIVVSINCLLMINNFENFKKKNRSNKMKILKKLHSCFLDKSGNSTRIIEAYNNVFGHMVIYSVDIPTGRLWLSNSR